MIFSGEKADECVSGTEFAFSRLMFPPGANDGYRGRFDGDWRKGLSLWTQDYPRADRHFSQAKLLREYLLRGGFFMADDLQGTEEWEVFRESMHRVFPDRPIVEIEDSDAIFHTVYDLNDGPQIPGAAHLRLGYKNDGIGAHWRAICDDKGRIIWQSASA